MLASWPVMARLGVEVPGHPASDTYDHLWGFQWFLHEVAHGRVPVRTTISHWPPGGALWYIDPVGAILSLPLQPLVGLGAAFSLVQVGTLWAGMLAGYALGLAYTRDRAAAVLAGVVYGSSAYALSLLHSGTTEFLHTAPIAIAWLGLRAAMRDGGRRAMGLAALAWVWATAANFYYSAFVVLLVPLAAWEARDVGWRELGERFATLLLTFGLCASPLLAWAAWSLTAPDAVVSQQNAPGWNYQTLPATDLLTFLHPGDYVFPDNRMTGNFGIRHVNYVGWASFLLGVAGAWRARVLRVPLLVTAVLALGPTLCVGGRIPTWGHGPIPLPAAVLFLPGSPLRMLHHPFRLVLLPTLFLAAGAAVATKGRPRAALLAAAVVVAEVLTVSPAIWPVPTAPWSAPAAVVELAGDPEVHAVWDFPPGAHVENRRWEMLATFHRKAMPYGVNQFLPAAFRVNDFVRAMLHCLKKPALTLIPREGGRPLPGWLDPPVAAQVVPSRVALKNDGYDVVVLHLDKLRGTEASCARDLLGPGSPRFRDGDAEGWNLRGEDEPATAPAQ